LDRLVNVRGFNADIRSTGFFLHFTKIIHFKSAT
jgi:hypothetical protein